MSRTLIIALAQINPTVGAIEANRRLIASAREQAAAASADLVVYPEMVLTGYPPEDLVRKPAVQAAALRAVESLAKVTADGGPGLIISAPRAEAGQLFNSAFVLDGGDIVGFRDKHHLPNYGVFDEKRVFNQGPCPGPVNFRDVRLGLMTCEDAWHPDVTECLLETGAEILIAPNGSPYELGKADARLGIIVARVTESGLPFVFVNQVGGQDELVFDGASFVLNPDRSLACQQPAFCETLDVMTFTEREGGFWAESGSVAAPLGEDEEVYTALMTALRDYVEKNRFPGVIIGLSGGIDSALTAAVAVDALGANRVRCVMMPSRYTSPESLNDAAACAKYLGIAYDTIDIEPAVAAMGSSLEDLFKGLAADTTEENIQARIRGILLMALSNKFGHMVVATGNKSEMSVGYATLYGDLCGGFALLKDVYKTRVYALGRWRNENRPGGAKGPDGPVIAENIFVRPPTAELRAEQTDQDSLPPYDVLDGILHKLIEGDMGVDEIAAAGFDRKTVERVEHMLYRAEYKRRQAPPGVKITRKQFGRDRRYPITNQFRDRPEEDA